MVLPVKIFLSGAAQVLAYTLDISAKGARLSGLREALQIGSTVKLLRGASRAEFRVVWVQQLDAKQIQVGVEALQLTDNFWGVDLKPEGEKNGLETNGLLELSKTKSNKQPLG